MTDSVAVREDFINLQNLVKNLVKETYKLEREQDLQLGVLRQDLQSLYWFIDRDIERGRFTVESYNREAKYYNKYAEEFDNIVNNNIKNVYFAFPQKYES